MCDQTSDNSKTKIECKNRRDLEIIRTKGKNFRSIFYAIALIVAQNTIIIVYGLPQFCNSEGCKMSMIDKVQSYVTISVIIVFVILFIGTIMAWRSNLNYTK